MPLPLGSLVGGHFRGPFGSHGGEEQPEDGTTTRLAVDLEAALVAPEDAQHGGKPQSPARELGGEEGIEDPLQHLAWHAAPRVAHLQRHVGPGRQRQGWQQTGGIGLVDGLDSGPERDEAAGPLSDGFRGIGHEVHDQLLHLSGISRDEWQIRGEVVAHHRLLGNGDRQELGHLQHQPVQVDLHDLQPSLAGIGEELAGQIGGPEGGLFDLLQDGLSGAFRGKPHGPQVRVAQDDRQEVVEVMGDAPGQDPQALQLLGLAQGVLGLLPLGDVGPDGHELDGRAVLPEKGHDGGVHPVVGAVLGAIPDFPLPHAPGEDGLPELRHEGLRVEARVDDPVVLAEQFLPGVLGDGAELLVHVGDAALGIGDGDDGVLVQGTLEILEFPDGPGHP